MNLVSVQQREMGSKETRLIWGFDMGFDMGFDEKLSNNVVKSLLRLGDDE